MEIVKILDDLNLHQLLYWKLVAIEKVRPLDFCKVSSLPLSSVLPGCTSRLPSEALEHGHPDFQPEFLDIETGYRWTARYLKIWNKNWEPWIVLY